MSTGGVREQVAQERVIAVLRAPSATGAVDAARAMLSGGVSVIEVTTTTPDWVDALRELASVDGITPGAGTLLTAEQVQKAYDAGARYAVSPGFSADVADACADRGLPYFPGIATPSELMTAQAHPATTALKLFPAEAIGGVTLLKALKGPFPGAEFVPTGGISAANAADYLKAGAVAVGLSSICKSHLIEAKDWDGITRMAKELLQAIA